MSNTPKKRTAAAENEADEAATGLDAAEETEAAQDPRDAQIEALRAELAAATAPEPEPEMDARDRTIADLKAQLDGLKSTPEGAAAEMAKALATLQDQVNRMQTGAGLVPVPVNENPDPFLYGAVLATGEVVYAQHPTATAHHSPEHEITVPVMSYFLLDAKTAELANA